MAKQGTLGQVTPASGGGMDATKDAGGPKGPGYDSTTQPRPPGSPSGGGRDFTRETAQPGCTPQTVAPSTVPAGGSMNTPGTPDTKKPFTLGS